MSSISLPLTTDTSENKDLTRVNDQLNSQLDAAQSRYIELVFSHGIKIGRKLQTLQLSKTQLEASNKTIEVEIDHLKKLHVIQLDSLIDNYSSKMGAVIAKMKAVTTSFGKFITRFGWVPEKSDCFELISEQFIKMPYETLRKYPECLGLKKDTEVTKDEKISDSDDIVLFVQKNTQLQKMAEPSIEECKSLEKIVSQLRSKNKELDDKKKAMPDSHAKFIELIKNREIKAKFSEILEKINDFYLNKIVWTIPVRDRELKTCPHPNCRIGSPYSKSINHRTADDASLIKINKIKSAIETIIKDLEQYIEECK